MEVSASKIIADFEQQPLLVQPVYRVGEIKLRKNHTGIIGKMRHIILEVFAGLRPAQGGKSVLGGIVKGIAC